MDEKKIVRLEVKLEKIGLELSKLKERDQELIKAREQNNQMVINSTINYEAHKVALAILKEGEDD